MIDETLLTAAKLREQIDGNIDGGPDVLAHAGTVTDPDDVHVLSWLAHALEDADDLPDDLEETSLGREVLSTFRTATATAAVQESDPTQLSHLVGVTEQDLDASALTLPARILDLLENDGALCTILAAGIPNSGKTNTVWLLVELARTRWKDLTVISNAKADLVDRRVTSAHELAIAILEEDGPIAVVIDEGSTHFDARTNSYEVAAQWSPLLKRMSKVGVELAAVIGHTGKDVDPEVKRLTTVGLYKADQETAEFYASWPADSDRPTDLLFGGQLRHLEPTDATYDPDDAAPWAWDLRADLFAHDLDWPDLLEHLREQGSAD